MRAEEIVSAKPGEISADVGVVQGVTPEWPEDDEGLSALGALSPAVTQLAPGAKQSFRVSGPEAAKHAAQWTVHNETYEVDSHAGSITPDGLYTAPLVAGLYHVSASVVSPGKCYRAIATVLVTQPTVQNYLSEDYSGYKPLILTDDNRNGIPDYMEAADSKKPPSNKPNAALANAGKGLPKSGEIIAAAGPGGGITRVDVVSNAQAIFPGAFPGACLLLEDAANWGMNYGVKYGTSLARGTVVLEYFQPTASNLWMDLGNQWKPGDSRMGANAVIQLNWKDGQLRFCKSSVPSAPGKIHRLTVEFDCLDTSAGVNGSYVVTLDGQAVGNKEPLLTNGAVDRISLHTAAAPNITNGLFLVGKLTVDGIASPVPAPIADTIVEVGVDWNQTQGKTTKNNYSVNGFTSFDPDNVANENYQKNMAYLTAGLVRLHNWTMLRDSIKSHEGWLKLEEKKWDAEKIKRVLDTWRAKIPSDLSINIPGWPEWMKSTNGALDPSEYEHYANFCAELVRIVNIEQKQKVKYWEITNERDDVYWVKQMRTGQPDQVEELVKIYNLCAVAMKKVDPTILTGGPAVARGDLKTAFVHFVQGTKANLDFFSYHAYASGNTSDSDDVIFDKTKLFSAFGSGIRKALDEASPNRHIELHFNEFNIAWTWQTHEPRMTNAKGGIFDALTMIFSTQAGIDVTNAWNERDGIYGKMSPDYVLRPAAHFFHAFSQYGVGERVKVHSGSERRVVPLAVVGDAGRSLFLVNRTAFWQPLQVKQAGPELAGNWERSVVTEEGIRVRPFAKEQVKELQWLPPFSLVVLVQMTK